MGLTLTYGAYMAEVYRAGIEAVPRGQTEAARSLGMSHGQAMRFVIVPQAVRKVIPPLLNDFIALMKDTSLVGILGALEVVQVGFDIQTEQLNGSALVLGAVLFLIVTIPLARLVDWLIARDQAKTRSAGQLRKPTTKPSRRGRRRPGWRGREAWPRQTRPLIGGGTRRRPDARTSTTSANASASSRCSAESTSRSTRGEVVCVIGPSGSGKSTLLRCINLLEPPEEGRILLEGSEITRPHAASVR